MQTLQNTPNRFVAQGVGTRIHARLQPDASHMHSPLDALDKFAKCLSSDYRPHVGSQQLPLQAQQRTNIVCSISCLLKLLLSGKTLDGSVQHEVLFHRDFWPQNVELWAHPKVLSDGSHIILNAQAIDHCIACKVHMTQSLNYIGPPMVSTRTSRTDTKG